MTSPSSNITCIERTRSSYQGSPKFLESGVLSNLSARPLGYGEITENQDFAGHFLRSVPSGCVVASVGSTPDEAKTAFLQSLAEPHLALTEETSLAAFGEGTDVIKELWE
jgi:hypothetical protein